MTYKLISAHASLTLLSKRPDCFRIRASGSANEFVCVLLGPLDEHWGRGEDDEDE